LIVLGNFDNNYEVFDSNIAIELPMFPTKLDEYEKGFDKFYKTSPPLNDKKIPRIIWIAVKETNETLPDHIYRLFERNKGYQVNIIGNEEKTKFIDTVFNNTRIQWAYHAINPTLGAAKTDIWRYLTLWLYGGIYIDDDSDIKTPFDEIIQPSDELILSEEGLPYEECYHPLFKLSNEYTFNKRFKDYNQTITSITKNYIHGYDQSKGYPLFFHGNQIINWALFAAPKSILFKRTLENIVDLVFHEYNREVITIMTRHTARFRLLLCSTGYILGTTLRELLLEGNHNIQPRFSTSHDFRQYGGVCKAIWTGNDHTNYRKTMQTRKGHDILHKYSNNMTAGIIHLEGHPISAHSGGRSIFLVQNQTRKAFGSLDTFNNMGFDLKHVIHISDDLYFALKEGSPVGS